MKLLHMLILSFSLLQVSKCWSDNRKRRFRDDFLFGAGTSAYQVEGAWNKDDKGESIWDRFLHENSEIIADGRNGDVASDSYHQYVRDVEMLRELGVDFYKFSISWSRVLPEGFTSVQNEKGFEYYDKLIDELLKYNIEPMIVLYHFDLPQHLQDLGGWTNPLSQHWFKDYAKTVFDRYANKVKYWITINQPNTICMDGYGDGTMAPGVRVNGIAEYMCVKNVLLAHARAYRLYEKKYKRKYKGSVGISLSLNWVDPVNNNTVNVQATEEYREFTIGLYMNPIWSKEGDFPRVVRDIVAKKSTKQGFARSRLPKLNADEVKLLKGASDFLGMNHYTTVLVKRSDSHFESPSFQDDANVDISHGEHWESSASTWLKSVPYGIYKVCVYLNKKYDYPTIFVTGHGWSTTPGLRDQSRVDNLRGYLSALLIAIEDGTELKGYTAWSLMDNVEWIAGTSERFGLYEVDFDSTNATRTARLSALVYKRIIEKRIVENDWKPENLNIQLSDKNLKKNVKVEL